MSDSSEETEYHLRFISMYIDLCTEVVYRVFVHAIPNKDTVSFFQSNRKLFRDLEKRKVLSKAEVAFVIDSSPRPEQFDVSLLIKILCNSKTTLAPPLNGWEGQPGPSDLSIADDLIRLRNIRNTIIGHRTRAKLPKYEFDRLWKEVKGILLRLANATDPSSEEGLVEKIEHYRKRPLQAQDEKTTFYQGKLQEWWKTCEEVSKLQNKVEGLVQEIQEISLYFKTKPQDYCLYIRLLFDGGRSVLCGILKKELSSRSLDLKTFLLERASQLKTNFINEEMQKQVFPHLNNPNIDYDSWDMLSLTIVVLNIFGDNLSEEVVKEIKIIEVAVKSYAQTAIESLDMKKFKSCCEDLVSSLKVLSNYVGGETKTNFEMHLQAYRSTDDEIDVDNYLNQMKLYALEIKSIPGIYYKTIADLKESANQMKETGVVFEREKDMDLKMIVFGGNKEKETLAETILEIVWKSALEMSSNSEELSSVRIEVDKILEEVRKIPSANITKVWRHCIILTIRYSSWEALLEILKYVESRTLREHFENISRELGYICGETVELSGIVTVESVHRAMIKLDKHKPREDSSLNVAISCSSVESMEKVVTMLNSDETRQIFSNIDHALSKCVGDQISVRASPDVKGFCHLLDVQEIPFIERSGQIASGLQSTEENDQEQMGKLSTDLSYQTAFLTHYPEQSGKPSTDLSNQTASKTEYTRQSGHNLKHTKSKRRDMSDSPDETEYYLRFISMYIDLCTGVVYRVFVHAIPNKDTVSFFQSNCKLFHDLEKRKVLSKAEIAFVVSSSPRPEQFDVSLLIKILCNSKTTLTPPLNGWDRQPGPSDLSIAADLLRLRKIRNIIIWHRPQAKLPKYKFDRLWEDVKGILLRLANATDPSSEEGLREKIEHYRNRPLQTQDEKSTFYLGKLQEWWQTCEEVSKLQNKVEDLVQKIQEFSLYFKTKPQDYCLYIRLLFDGGRSVLSGILKKELSSRGLDLKTLLLERASQLETNFINEEMRKQVFPHPNNPNTDYDSWDMLTLTTVVLHIFGDNLSEEVVKEIKIIEVAVKSYAQRAIESLDMTKFKSSCEDLVSSLKALSNYVGGETKTNFKTHFEAYRNTDDEIDVDNYLKQMAHYALEIESIPDIYYKAIADLKESANQMKEEGVVFEREKDKHKPREDSSLKVAISCSSVESMEKVFTMLKSDETRQIFSNIDHALSKCVRDRINVRASPDVKECCHLFDIQEIPFIERSGQIAGSLQSTEEKDQEQMEKLSTDLSLTASMKDCPEQSGNLSTDLCFQTGLLRHYLDDFGSSEVVGLLLSEKNDLELKGRRIMRRFSFSLFDCISLATILLKILNPFEGRTFENPDYLRRQMFRFLRDYSEQFDSVLHVLKELSSIAMLFKDDIYSGVNYEDVLDEVNTPASRSFKSLVLYAIATYLNIRFFVLSRNCLGHLQWFYFCPLFEFKTQHTFSSSSYISVYWSSNEFYIIGENTNVPPKAYGLLGMYLTALNDIPIDRIDVSRKLVNIPYDRKELLCGTMDKDIVEECCIASGAPKRSQFVTFVKDSKDAFTIVCKELVKNTALKMLNSHLSDVDALVDESKYVECHRMVCEINEAMVEINFEVSKFVNKCEKLIPERGKKYVGQTLDKTPSVQKEFTSVSNALDPVSVGSSFEQAPTDGAMAPTTAVGPKWETSGELNRAKQKEIDELLIFLNTKLKKISETEKTINDFFEEASLFKTINVQRQARHIFRSYTYVESADIIETINCKQRVINSIFRGSFEDLERMITLRKRNTIKVEI